MGKVSIRLLGSFHIDVDGQSADDIIARSPRGITLMECLLLSRGEAVPVRRLIDIMWPGDCSASPESALKTLVSRLRTLLAQISPQLSACLVTARGGYRWEKQPDVVIDVDTFEQIAASLAGCGELNQENRDRFRAAQDVYRGMLLADQEQQDWIVARAGQLHERYLALVARYLDFLEQEGNEQEFISVCRLALDADPFDEMLNLRLADALLRDNRHREALQQYRGVASLQSGASSSEEALMRHFNRLRQAGRALDESLSALRIELTAPVSEKGALVCDSAVFQELYQLERRSLERQKGNIMLGMVMVSGMDDHPLQLDQVMTGLVELMAESLRRGDIITRLTVNQVAVLLPMADEAGGRVVMVRVKEGFYRRFPAETCVLTCGVVPLNGMTNGGIASRRP